jgi:O-antigen/teichoic acid export membrane protein
MSGSQSSAKKYARNTSWILIEKMARIVSGILVGILVARYLGPEQFGQISYALNVMAIFAVLSTLGLDSIIVRELIVRKDHENVILGTSFIMRIAGAVAAIACATYYSSIRDNPEEVMIVFIVTFSLFLQSLTVIDLYFQAKIKGEYPAINQVITLVLSAIVKLWLIAVKAGVEYFASMVILESVITAFNQYLFYKRSGGLIWRWRFAFAEVKRLLGHALPIIASGLVMMVYQKMDQILIKRFLDFDTLGNYAAAVRITEASFFIPVAISAAVFPGIINNQHNKELQTKRLTQLYSLLLWVAVIICIGASLVGHWVIGFLYKQDYDLAPLIFRIHVWICVPVFFGAAWGVWMIAENKQKRVIILNVISLILCYMLNVTLIPMLGVTGAAYSVVITYYMGLVAMIMAYKPKYTLTLFARAMNPANLFDLYKYYKSGNRENL